MRWNGNLLHMWCVNIWVKYRELRNIRGYKHEHTKSFAGTWKPIFKAMCWLSNCLIMKECHKPNWNRDNGNMNESAVNEISVNWNCMQKCSNLCRSPLIEKWIFFLILFYKQRKGKRLPLAIKHTDKQTCNSWWIYDTKMKI